MRDLRIHPKTHFVNEETLREYALLFVVQKRNGGYGDGQKQQGVPLRVYAVGRGA